MFSAKREQLDSHGELVVPTTSTLELRRSMEDEKTKVEREEDYTKGTRSNEDSSQDDYNSQISDSIDEESREYLTGLPLVFLTIGLCVATFALGLDQLIVTTAIPQIATHFRSLNDVGWYGSAYLLTTTSLQPSFGKIYALFNVKLTVIFALIIFEVGSILCASAPSSAALIVGRAVVGCGAAGIFCGGMTIIGYAVPLARRTIYIAALYGMFGISSIVGQIIGGYFTDKLSWRWCFWVNLPFGITAILLVTFFFKNPARKEIQMSLREKIRQLDIAGALFLIGGVVCLLLALQWGGVQYPWGDSRVWGNFLGFGLLSMMFIIIQIRRGDQATIPMRMLKQPTIIAAALTLFLISMEMYIHSFYLPFYFQVVRGTTAQDSGIQCTAYLIANTLGAVVVGGLVTVFGYYTPFIWFGAAVTAVGSGLLYTLNIHSTPSAWIGYQLLAGFGSGCATQLPFIAVQVVSTERDMPTANAIAIFFYSLGGAMSVSIAQNIFSNTMIKDILRLAPGVDPQLILLSGGSMIRAFVPKKLLSMVLLAYNNALMAAFVIPIIVVVLSFFASLMFEWRSVKEKPIIPETEA